MYPFRLPRVEGAGSLPSHLRQIELERMLKPAVQEIAASLGIDKNQNKGVLIDAIIAKEAG